MSRRCLCTARYTCTPTTHEAAMEHASLLRRQEIADELGMTRTLLNKQLNPDDDLNNFPLKKFRKFLRAAQSQLPLDVLCREEGGLFVRLPDVSITGSAIHEAITDIAEELGQAVTAVRESLAAQSEGGAELTLAEADHCARQFDDIAAKSMNAKARVLAMVGKAGMARMTVDAPGARRKSA